MTMTCNVRSGSCYNTPRLEAELDAIERFNLKLRTKVRSKKLNPGAIGQVFNVFKIPLYNFLLKKEIELWKNEYPNAQEACFVELENGKVEVFPNEDLEEVE